MRINGGADHGFSRPSAAGKPQSSVHGCIYSVSRKTMIRTTTLNFET